MKGTRSRSCQQREREVRGATPETEAELVATQKTMTSARRHNGENSDLAAGTRIKAKACEAPSKGLQGSQGRSGHPIHSGAPGGHSVDWQTMMVSDGR